LHVKAIAPKFTALAASFSYVRFLRVDVDKLQPIAAKYKITAMPTFIAIVNGEVKETVGSSQNKIKHYLIFLVTRCRSSRLSTLGGTKCWIVTASPAACGRGG
jgi:thiol-disulfide isomerase/thioredoxin